MFNNLSLSLPDLASGFSIGETGLGAAGRLVGGFTAADNSIQSGQQTASFDEFKAQQLQDSATVGRTKAAQTDEFLRRQVSGRLGALAAINASAGVSSDSPTGQAIAARTQGQGDQERNIRVGSILSQSELDQQGSQFYTKAAQDTLNAAYDNASNSILGGFLGGAASLFTGLSGSKPG